MEETQKDTLRDEIRPAYYARVVWKHKRLISGIVGAALAGAVIVSYVARPVYEAKAVITPIARSSESAGFMGMSAIATQFGISPPASSNIWEIINLLKSDVLKEKMIKNHDLLPVLLEKGAKGGKSEEQRMWKGIRRLQEASSITFSQRENSIRISVIFKDPKTAAELLSFTLSELTDHMSSEARRVAEANKRYLEMEVDRTADPFIRTKIYSMIAQQIEASLLAEVKENFAFKVLDPPRVPDRKKGPRRGLIVTISFVASLFLGIFAALGKEFWANKQ
jgi:uncharacterized protein involved in exopolysaccharide biosynthesis